MRKSFLPFIATFFTIALYANDSIPVSVLDVFVYTSTDLFAVNTSTSQVLNAFGNHINTLTYDGRLAHLLSTRTLGGGIHWVMFWFYVCYLK